MLLHATDPLFAWAKLEDHPQLSTLRQLLEILPDDRLLAGLRQARGRGRDDYPLEHLGGVVVFTMALRPLSVESCLAELHRNPSLYRLLGIATVADIPKPWNVSRFLEVLGHEPHLAERRTIFDVLVQRLGHAVPDLGAPTAGDAPGLNGRAKKDRQAVADEGRQGLPQPSGGRKEYKDDAGQVVRVVEWFGSKPHLLVDVKHAVPLAYRVTDTKAGDHELIAALVAQAKANLPADRIQTLAYAGRTAVARVNARTKIFWGMADGHVTGARRCPAYVGVVMVVCVGLATLLALTPRREGSLGGTRLGPIALALQAALADEASQADQSVPAPAASAACLAAQGQPDTS